MAEEDTTTTICENRDAAEEDDWEQIFNAYREDDKTILQTGGGGPSRGWAINDNDVLWLWRQQGGNPKSFYVQGGDMELLIRPANEHSNLYRCRLVSCDYEIPDESYDFIFSYE